MLNDQYEEQTWFVRLEVNLAPCSLHFPSPMTSLTIPSHYNNSGRANSLVVKECATWRI
jgi:hypothetical protein